jgi:hypothetical protein
VAGRVAQRHSLTLALGLIGMLYLMATMTSFWGARTSSGNLEQQEAVVSAE